MNSLDQQRPDELKVVDDLFSLSSGYALDFTNSTFDDFFRREVGVDIYVQGPDSKEKRMRAFLGQPC
ncbi:MAG: hypothetical protein KJZ78_29935 [Bryobacteraceae bacterium]|nr:hypothetical protein [Bryobacteraceae bacterium]